MNTHITREDNSGQSTRAQNPSDDVEMHKHGLAPSSSQWGIQGTQTFSMASPLAGPQNTAQDQDSNWLGLGDRQFEENRKGKREKTTNCRKCIRSSGRRRRVPNQIRASSMVHTGYWAQVHWPETDGLGLVDRYYL